MTVRIEKTVGGMLVSTNKDTGTTYYGAPIDSLDYLADRIVSHIPEIDTTIGWYWAMRDDVPFIFFRDQRHANAYLSRT